MKGQNHIELLAAVKKDGLWCCGVRMSDKTVKKEAPGHPDASCA